MNRAHSRPLNSSHSLGVDGLNFPNERRDGRRRVFSPDSVIHTAVSFAGITPPSREALAVSHIIEKDS